VLFSTPKYIDLSTEELYNVGIPHLVRKLNKAFDKSTPFSYFPCTPKLTYCYCVVDRYEFIERSIPCKLVRTLSSFLYLPSLFYPITINCSIGKLPRSHWEAIFLPCIPLFRRAHRYITQVHPSLARCVVCGRHDAS
jgi:hypothetical protein